MARIVAIPGSLRHGSLNAALLRAAAELTPEGSSVEVASIRGIPLYDGDLDAASGPPREVDLLKERIATCDGLLIATPEYNQSIPGVLKNAIDWLSRPASDIPRVWGGRPVGLLGVTPGRSGTVVAQGAWLPVLRALRTRPWFGGSLALSGGRDLFRDGELTDDDGRERVKKYMAGFIDFVAEAGRSN